MKRSKLKPGRRRREPTPDKWAAPHGYHAHHVLTRARVQMAGGDIWDPRNRMIVDECRHFDHHHGTRRIPMVNVPDDALAFAVDLIGAGPAFNYFTATYAGPDPRLAALLRSTQTEE